MHLNRYRNLGLEQHASQGLLAGSVVLNWLLAHLLGYASSEGHLVVASDPLQERCVAMRPVPHCSQRDLSHAYSFASVSVADRVGLDRLLCA